MVVGFDEETHDAGETAIGELVDRSNLAERDRICYLYDYGDEWRFYGIFEEIVDDESGERPPEVVGAKGDPVDQYEMRARRAAAWLSGPSLRGRRRARA